MKIKRDNLIQVRSHNRPARRVDDAFEYDVHFRESTAGDTLMDIYRREPGSSLKLGGYASCIPWSAELPREMNNTDL